MVLTGLGGGRGIGTVVVVSLFVSLFSTTSFEDWDSRPETESLLPVDTVPFELIVDSLLLTPDTTEDWSL